MEGKEVFLSVTQWFYVNWAPVLGVLGFCLSLVNLFLNRLDKRKEDSYKLTIESGLFVVMTEGKFDENSKSFQDLKKRKKTALNILNPNKIPIRPLYFSLQLKERIFKKHTYPPFIKDGITLFVNLGCENQIIPTEYHSFTFPLDLITTAVKKCRPTAKVRLVIYDTLNRESYSVWMRVDRLMKL